jgi:hypothetical protein
MLRLVALLGGLLLACAGCVPVNLFGGPSWGYPYSYTPYYGGPYSGPYWYPPSSPSGYYGYGSSVGVGMGFAVH